jgi:large subunit ribosomal protein L11
MATETVQVLIEGGKATAAPPLGPALGPLGVNIGLIVTEINKKTADFKGMQVPVKVAVDTTTKEFSITVGTPPASQLIIKEAKVQKGSSVPHTDLVADLKIEQVIKIAKMKSDALLGKGSKERVKEIVGTCQSMGVMVEGKKAQITLKDIDAGVYDAKIASGKTEITAEEQKALEEERKKLQKELKEKREDFLADAKAILNQMQGKEGKAIRNAMTEAGIPIEIIKELVPEEEKKPAGAGAKK